ncbi:MAG: terpene cyclase/mutase family protein [Phycisphaerales bacterium]|nr:terpene cyclase/mutase family protein [Phycisphaerales bacterium]
MSQGWIHGCPKIDAATPLLPAQRTGTPGPQEAPEIRREPVERMTSALSEAILQKHHASRQWEPARPPSDQSAQPTGRTAIAVLALLEAGMPVQTPRITTAVDWLRRNPATGTYAIAARLMVWTRLNDAFLPLARSATARLLERFSIEGGGWDYGPDPRARFVDQSLTQFSMQALADASARGIAIPRRLADIVRRRFLARQGREGGWGYRDPNDPPRGSMTAAGLATLAICNRLSPGSRSDQARTETAIAAAIGWLDQHFDPESNPGFDRWHLYWIHSLERAARATGIRRFGGHDWYSECAATIRRRLFVKDDSSGLRLRGNPRIERLAFALFSLQRGLDPIAFTCFDSTGETPAHDLLGGAVTRISTTLEKPVSWMRVGLEDSAAAWRRAPVLIIRGGANSAWIKDPGSIPSRRIFEHAANGGLVVAIPTVGGSNNRTLLQARLRAVFDAHTTGLSLTPVADDDAARRIAGRWRVRADQLRSPIRRWVVFPRSADLLGAPGHRTTDITASMLAGLCLHACHGRLPSRLPSETAALDDSAAIATLRRVEHPGNWNPEPGMLRRWAAFAATLPTPPHTLDPAVRVAWLTGVDDRDADGLALSTIARGLNGAVLVVESLSPDFTRAFTRKAAAAGWRITLPPGGCPAAIAGIKLDDDLIGLLIDAGPARLLFEGPSSGGCSIADLTSLHHAVRRIHAELLGDSP